MPETAEKERFRQTFRLIDLPHFGIARAGTDRVFTYGPLTIIPHPTVGFPDFYDFKILAALLASGYDDEGVIHIQSKKALKRRLMRNRDIDQAEFDRVLLALMRWQGVQFRLERGNTGMDVFSPVSRFTLAEDSYAIEITLDRTYIEMLEGPMSLGRNLKVLLSLRSPLEWVIFNRVSKNLGRRGQSTWSIGKDRLVESADIIHMPTREVSRRVRDALTNLHDKGLLTRVSVTYDKRRRIFRFARGHVAHASPAT
jgi:hypothetical protein